MRKIMPRKTWSRKAVSDIIGNLLILAITVTLFSSILWFAMSMPGPSQKVYTDFTSHVDIDDADDKAWINLTHNGGQTLFDYKTRIYMFVDGTPTELYITSSYVNIGEEWTTGEVWTYLASGVDSHASLRVMILDVEANTIVWDSVLRGAQISPNAAPIIGNRGTNPYPILEGTPLKYHMCDTGAASSM